MSQALTGDPQSAAGPIGPNPAALIEALAAAGWPAARLRARRRERLAAEESWPFPVPESARAGIGPAQWQAVVQELIDRLDLRSTRTGSAGGPLEAADRRLLADRPPHW